MNILFLANHFNPGGISSYILNLAQALTARGHKVWVGSSPGEWVERLAKYNIRHINLGLRTKSILSPKLWLAYFALKKVVAGEKIELIHTNTRVTSVLASGVSKKTGVPFISTAHGFFKASWERKTFPCWGRLVIAISEAVKEHLIKDFGVSPDRIKLVHNGINTAGYGIRVAGYDRDVVREKFGLKEGPVVGIIARLSEVKGHKYLIRAMKKVIEQIPDVQLLSVGDGKIKKDLEALAGDMGIRERISFIPEVSDTAEPLSVMDVFVMPSLQEGLGLSIMEAMLAGVPVAASAVGGIVSLVKDGLTGILVKPRDPDGLAGAIIDLLKDREKARRLAVNARALILEEFSLEKMVGETEKAYQQCLS